MKNNQQEKANNHIVAKAGLGLLAAALGAYYFFGKEEGEKHRQETMEWMNKAKRDLIAELKDLKEISAEKYEEVSDQVIEKYRKFQEENPKEFELLVKELKGHWSRIKSHLTEEAKKTVKTAKKKIAKPN